MIYDFFWRFFFFFWRFFFFWSGLVWFGLFDSTDGTVNVEHGFLEDRHQAAIFFHLCPFARKGLIVVVHQIHRDPTTEKKKVEKPRREERERV